VNSKRRQPGQALSSQQQARLRHAIHAHSTGQLPVAEAEYRALIAEDARVPELYCNLANICAQTARRDEADALWKQALEIDPRSLEAHMNLADSCQQAGDIEQAGRIYRRVMADHGGFFVARYLLGNILKSQGKLDEARACYERVMSEQPGYTQAHFSYSGIHRYKDGNDPHLRAMLDLYRRTDLKRENRIHLGFALGKAFEDIGDYAEAFRYLKSGNDLRAEEFNYDIQSDRALIESIRKAFTRDAIARHQVATETSSRPIFIVGMPRSGTTLVEKILASHSDVFGAGELEYMFALGTSLFLSASNNFEFQSLDAYEQSLFETAGRTYLDKLARLNSEARHITDKMPFNMMMIGLIRIALPHAKIIHCVRDPRDTCLSIYKQNFTTGNYRFAYDLRAVGQFHNLYRELMEHWHDVQPGAIYDVSYESLTQNPDDQIRKLLSHCDLDFEERCLHFDKTEAVIKTASAFQVRQPIYTSSVGLWREYGEFIGPMLDELELDAEVDPS
jgi:tetratricopeptide (TPR) repeat protein